MLLRYLRRFGMARSMLLINTLILSLSRLTSCSVYSQSISQTNHSIHCTPRALSGAARNNEHFRKHGYDIDDEVVLYADDKDNGKLEFKSVNDLMRISNCSGWSYKNSGFLSIT